MKNAACLCLSTARSLMFMIRSHSRDAPERRNASRLSASNDRQRITVQISSSRLWLMKGACRSRCSAATAAARSSGVEPFGGELGARGGSRSRRSLNGFGLELTSAPPKRNTRISSSLHSMGKGKGLPLLEPPSGTGGSDEAFRAAVGDALLGSFPSANNCVRWTGLGGSHQPFGAKGAISNKTQAAKADAASADSTRSKQWTSAKLVEAFRYGARDDIRVPVHVPKLRYD